MDDPDLRGLIDEAWRQHRSALREPWLVKPSAPVLFFGDLDAFRTSRLRVLTVALNPSDHEFPASEPFLRFPGAEASERADSYVAALSGYFGREPYWSWFAFYEEALRGMGVSYCGAPDGTALHTDVGSPLPTEPTWSKLGQETTSVLQAGGQPLWHRLTDYLEPDIVLWSTAHHWLDLIEFDGLGEWRTLIEFTRKQDGTPRQTPVRALSRIYGLSGGKRSLFVFAPAQIKPLGELSHVQKR
jgi:hypothetical protein